MPGPPIIFDTNFPAPVEDLWAAWTEAERLGRWLATKANVVIRVGGPFELFWKPETPEIESTLGCVVLGFDEEYELRFSWKGPSQFASLMNQPPLPTSVSVRFQPLGPARSRLHLEHSGWGTGAEWDAARQWHERVWKEALERLQKLLSGP